MSKTIIVSNRLPLQVNINNDELQITPSVGGLATGMKSIHAEGNGIWIGWSGLTEESLTPELSKKVDAAVAAEKCVSVPLNESDLENYYLGFSNKALWPLFHYFLEYAEFELEQWKSYQEVNQKFADVVLDHLDEGDTLWIHDYQLLLLPKLIKDVRPDVSIGFFLHIPFPSYEIFRTFPWRESLLNGMLGADLIGFHTYDYERHFLSSVKRILRLDAKFNQVSYKDRFVKLDSFPMGIDYEKFNTAARDQINQSHGEKSELQKRLDDHIQSSSGAKMILSIDRLDYTKGIPQRLRAFEYFLNKYPQFKEKVRLVILAVPSRSNVPQYQRLKRETDELVGRINGNFSTVSWTPIWYFYRSMPFENLIDLYTSSDILLITPLRDGMNLVAKEYVATRIKQDGVLILSEMTGASNEMDEAILINPSNFEQLADSIKQAIEMPFDEQQHRMKILQKRMRRYSVEKWADEFMKSLNNTRTLVETIDAKRLNSKLKSKLLSDFVDAKRKLVLLDYDGTLVGFKNNPKEAAPDEELYDLLKKINRSDTTDLVIISGRDRDTLEEWFGDRPLSLISDHGVWLKKSGEEWEALERLKNDWMENIQPVLETFSDRTPGTFIEKKNYSIAWHYRKADPELAQKRVSELMTVISSLIGNNNLTILEGNKVLEIKSSNINKGRAAANLLVQNDYDFILGMGDDRTDEFMFEELPDNAYTIKVGLRKTAAKYFIQDTLEVRELLKMISNA